MLASQATGRDTISQSKLNFQSTAVAGRDRLTAYSLQSAGQGQTAITSSMEENEVAKEADPGEKDIHDHEKRHLPLLPAWRLVSRVRRGRAGVGEERSLM